MKRRRLRVTIVGSLCVVAAMLIAAVTGCGGGDSSSASANPAIPSSPPNINVPEGLPPQKLVVKDLRKGTGAAAKKGDKVMIHYYCVLWKGEEYTNSWRYSHIPVFVLGEHRLLRGLNLTIPGMKEGGSKEVTIPSNMVFYPEDEHPHLGRLDALICKVYLVKILGKKRQE